MVVLPFLGAFVFQQPVQCPCYQFPRTGAYLHPLCYRDRRFYRWRIPAKDFCGEKGHGPLCRKDEGDAHFRILPALLAQPLGVHFNSPWWPAVLIGLAAAGHQAWSANLFSTIGDMFPKSTIATITGIGAMAGGVGSMIIQKVAGNLFTFAETQGAAFSFLGFEGKPAGYFIVFCFCGIAYLLAWCIMKALVPVYKPINK